MKVYQILKKYYQKNNIKAKIPEIKTGKGKEKYVWIKNNEAKDTEQQKYQGQEKRETPKTEQHHQKQIRNRLPLQPKQKSNNW